MSVCVQDWVHSREMVFNAVSVVLGEVGRKKKRQKGKPITNLSSMASCFCMVAHNLRWRVSPGQKAGSHTFFFESGSPWDPVEHGLPSSSLPAPKPRGPGQECKRHCLGKSLLSKFIINASRNHSAWRVNTVR